MEIRELLKPRFVIGVISIVGVFILMFTETIDADAGISLLIGILISFGAYYVTSPRDR